MATSKTLAVIILAAGKGTRMQSDIPKVLHKIAGLPMVEHVIAAAQSLKPERIVLVTAPSQKNIRMHVQADNVHHAIQDTPNGTGDAVRAAQPYLGDAQRAVVLFGDTPLIRADILHKLAYSDAALSVLGFETDKPDGYGRILMQQGQPVRIIEEKDADADIRAITLCNGGAMAFDCDVARDLLPHLSSDNAQGEYYLPDLLHLAAQKNHKCALVTGIWQDSLGVDSRAGLARAEAIMQARLREKFFSAGITLEDPQSVYFSYDTQIAADVHIEPHVKFDRGVRVETGAVIKAFSHLEGVTIGRDASIGPFARLRPGTKIGDAAKIGNFVETKNARLDEGVKVSHLSYIGDAQIGAHANIGAGTITCNYDGFEKHMTHIGEGAFIGSNSSLIAPINIGAGAYVGSSSAIGGKVEADALAVTRAPKRIIKNWAAKFRAKFAKERK